MAESARNEQNLNIDSIRERYPVKDKYKSEQTTHTDKRPIPFEDIDVSLCKDSANCTCFITNNERIHWWIVAVENVLRQNYKDTSMVKHKTHDTPYLMAELSVSKKKLLFKVIIYMTTGKIMVQGSKWKKFCVDDFNQCLQYVNEHSNTEVDNRRDTAAAVGVDRPLTSRRDGSERKSVHAFIDKFKFKVNINQFRISKLEERVESFKVPLGREKEDRFIHGDIFENSIYQAARGSSSLDQLLLNKFEERYKKDNQNLYDRYVDGMTNAGSVAWEFITKIESRSNSDNFQIEITNRLYPALSENLRSDFIYPNEGKPKFICDFKFSSKSPKKYEKEYLVDGFIQVLIYCLCLGFSPDDVKLGVLVFYSKENKIVFYESKCHDKKCVRLLEKHMKGRPQASDSNSDSESTDTDTSASTSDNDMPDLERLAITN